MTSKKLSILINTRNGERFLPQMLDSLFSQMRNDFEVIAVDDGSTDGTCRILSDYPIKLHAFGENRGLPTARNKALELAQGEYVAFLDQDDIIVPGSFMARLAYLTTHGQEAVVGQIADVINEQGKRLGDFYELSGKERPQGKLRWKDISQGENLPGALWLYMFKTAFLKRQSPFDPAWDILCDQEYLYRLIQQHDINHQPIPVAHYRIHSTNTTVHWEKGGIGTHPRTKALGVMLAMKYKITG